MKKIPLLISGLVVIALLLALKEWLVSEEVSSTQNQIKTLIAQEFENANSASKITELTSSAVAYEHYLEPVIIIANKLIWPAHRSSITSDWSNEVHTEILKASQKRKDVLSSKLDENLKGLRDSAKPGVERLIAVLQKSEELGADLQCASTVQQEMKSIKEYASEIDTTTVAALKEEGLLRIRELRKLLKKANQNKIGQLLSSGRFLREIEQPAISLILKIKQEDLRTAAWQEFSKKLSEVLTKKNILLAHSEKTKRQREIEKLFNDPAIHALANDSREQYHDLSPTPSPLEESTSEESLYENLGNPSDSATP
jgi:hypothetical protein